MKNLKNMAAAMVMMVVLGVGVVSADPGLLISDRTTPTQQPCIGGVLQNAAGVINGLGGLLISDFTGIIIIDATNPGCVQATDGIIIID